MTINTLNEFFGVPNLKLFNKIIIRHYLHLEHVVIFEMNTWIMDNGSFFLNECATIDSSQNNGL